MQLYKLIQNHLPKKSQFNTNSNSRLVENYVYKLSASFAVLLCLLVWNEPRKLFFASCLNITKLIVIWNKIGCARLCLSNDNSKMTKKKKRRTTKLLINT